MLGGASTYKGQDETRGGRVQLLLLHNRSWSHNESSLIEEGELGEMFYCMVALALFNYLLDLQYCMFWASFILFVFHRLKLPPGIQMMVLMFTLSLLTSSA